MDEITITKVTDDSYVVKCAFANGYEFAERCESEDQARAYARGLIHGITNVKNMIGTGPKFDARIK